MAISSVVGFQSFGVDTPAFPVLLSVPHAGRDYPDDIFQSLRLPRSALLRLEDRYSDLLARDAITHGYPTIIARRARAWIDLNREEHDIDVEMVRGADRAQYPTPGAKQRGGLGLIPRRLSGAGDLWKAPFELADIERRIDIYHRPYHATISAVLEHMRDIFGVAILLDLHSMPPLKITSVAPPPQFVVGDRFGKSAGSKFAEIVTERIRERGFGVALNHPYAGEYILRRHANPAVNIHALQLEVDRSLYLDSALREPCAGLGAMALLIRGVADALTDEALGSLTLMAAE